jgi:hypothetical protein
VQKTKAPRSKRVREQRDVGAIVFLIRHWNGECEIMSPDRQIYAYGATLQQAFSRYYRKGLIAMRKSGKIAQAHPMDSLEPIVEEENETLEPITESDDFKDV